MFVDRNGGVNNMWNDSFAFDDRLDVIVDVVVYVLSDDYIMLVCCFDRQDLLLVFEFTVLCSKRCLDLFILTMVYGPFLYWDNIMMVPLFLDNFILDWLNMNLVMVLVNITVDGLYNILMLFLDHSFMYHRRLGLLFYFHRVFVPMVKKLGNGLLRGLHGEIRKR